MVAAVGLTGSHAPGATALTREDVEGLLHRHVTTRGQLNELEEVNILDAHAWLGSTRTKIDPLNFSFAMTLHQRMFGNVWAWAGAQRPGQTNVGVAPERIAPDLKQWLDNTRYRLLREPAALDRIATEFHHQLVSVHPFRDGNGRHARLLTDLLLEAHGAKRYSWGSTTLTAAGPTRDRYIAALVAADSGNYALLEAFVRS